MGEEFAERIMDYRPLLLRVAAGVVGSEEAEDCVAEAIVKAWLARGRYDERSLANWLAAICRNTCLDRLRRRAARPATVPLGDGLVRREPGPEAAYLAAERDAAIRLAVARLTPLQRRAVEGYYFRGLASAPLAALLGCQRATVSVQLWRARQSLRSSLAGWR